MSGKARRREQKDTARQRAAVAEKVYKADVPDAIPEDLAEDTEWALTFKQYAVAENMFDVGDIPPLIAMYRDGKQLLRAFTWTIDRDIGLEFVRIGAPGFGAEAVTFTADAHMADARFVGEKGRAPDPHELQHLCDNEGACDIGLTTDALYMVNVSRGGQCRGVSLPYHVNKRAREVHWQPDVFVMQENGPDDYMSGNIPDALKAFINAPIAEMPEVDNSRWLADMHVLAVLTMIGYPIMWATESDEEHARNLEFLSSVGVSMDGKPPTGQAPASMLYMAKRAEMAMRERSQATHAAELAEAARRRAERGEAPAEWATPKS